MTELFPSVRPWLMSISLDCMAHLYVSLALLLAGQEAWVDIFVNISLAILHRRA